MLARPLCAQCSALSRRTLTTALSASMWTARAQSAPSLAYLAALPRGLPASSSLRTLATSSALSQGYTSPRAGSKGRARRPPPELPELRTLSSRAPAYLAILLAVLSSWSAFLFYTYNNDRAQSTIVKSLMFILRNSQEIRELIGDRVRLETLFGQFSRVKGSVSCSSLALPGAQRLTGTSRSIS